MIALIRSGIYKQVDMEVKWIPTKLVTVLRYLVRPCQEYTPHVVRNNLYRVLLETEDN